MIAYQVLVIHVPGYPQGGCDRGRLALSISALDHAEEAQPWFLM
jgi:hypothetical protein